MDLGWLVDGVTGLSGGLPAWLGNRSPGTLLLLAGLVVAAAVMFGWRQGRRTRLPPQELHTQTQTLLSQLRLRLAESAGLLGDAPGSGPTLGAREVLEADIAAAARVVVEAGGSRTKAKEILRKRATANGSANGHLNGSEAACWRQLGALSFLDRTQDALAAYARAADLAPDDGHAHLLLGLLHLRTGKLEAAEAAFRHQIELAERGPATGPERHRGLAMLGDTLAAGGDDEQALASYEAARDGVARLIEKAPENAALLRDSSVIQDRIGDVLLARGMPDEALVSFRKSLAVVEDIAAREPENAELQRDLSVTCDRIGDALERMGDIDGALASYRKGLAIAEALAARDSDRTSLQWDLSVSLERVGDLLAVKGNAEGALESYRRALAIAEALVRSAPDHVGWQRDLAISAHKTGSLLALSGRIEEARELFERGRAIIARLERIAAYRAQWRSDLAKFDRALQGL